MSEKSEPPPAPPASRGDSWARSTMWMGIVLFLVVGGAYVFKSCRDVPGDLIDKTGQAIGKAGNALATVAAAFNQGTVTTSFLSYATSISNNHYLQFATLRQTEVFTQTDEASTGFGYIPLPEVIVEARAPVEFTYYLDLNAKWQLLVKDNVFYVLAPPIQFNKPAVDASAIRYEVRKDSVFRNTAQAQENLKQSITFLANRRARENINLVRETGRRQTTEFVERWLMKTYTDGKQYPVKVYFADESFPGESPPGGNKFNDLPGR